DLAVGVGRSADALPDKREPTDADGLGVEPGRVAVAKFIGTCVIGQRRQDVATAQGRIADVERVVRSASVICIGGEVQGDVRGRYATGRYYNHGDAVVGDMTHIRRCRRDGRAITEGDGQHHFHVREAVNPCLRLILLARGHGDLFAPGTRCVFEI